MLSFVLDIRDKVLLFDFDGTLVATEYLAQEVIDEYFKELNLGYHPPSALIIGRTWEAATEGIVDDAKLNGVKLEAKADLQRLWKKHYHAKLTTGVKLVPGLKECIESFRAQARGMALVTGSDHQEVQTVLKYHQLEGYFDRIWAFGDYEKSKPDPSPFLTALKGLSAAPEDVIVFEDSPAGMESASRAGLSFVQVAYEAHAKVPDPRALRVIKDWNDFILS
jgi:HAD superfamily hydrolase (TIGR01509 family)